MERCQYMRHETQRQSHAVGGPTTSGRGVAAVGFGCPGSRSAGGLVGVVRHAVAGGGQARGRQGLAREAAARTTGSAVAPAAEAVVGDAARGSRGARVRNGPVDAPPSGGGHRALLRRPLPSGARVEDPARLRVESAEARAAGPGARRGRDRALAAATMAAYKKTRGAKVRASSSWMRAALCSSRWSGGRD